jgi:hypothetical protein
MVRAEIVLPDARLLWFYTFDDEPGDDDGGGEPA